MDDDSDNSRNKSPFVEKYSKAAIQEILEDEDIDSAMKNENYGMLQYLMNYDDKDIQKIIMGYKENESSEYLLTSLMSRTESALDELFTAKFSNPQMNKLRLLRSQRDN